jgi:regulatory protein
MRERSASSKNSTDPLARAVDLLSRREHSPAELVAKLRAKGFMDDEINAAVELLIERGLLSTERYVHARVQQTVSRGQGPRRLRQRLREAGLDGRAIDTQLAQETEGIDWEAQATEACARKFGSDPAADRREWNRRARFLLARGFDQGSVRKVLGDCPRG